MVRRVCVCVRTQPAELQGELSLPFPSDLIAHLKQATAK